MFGSYFSGQATTAERLAYVLLALAVLAYSSVTIGAELGLIAPRCSDLQENYLTILASTAEHFARTHLS